MLRQLRWIAAGFAAIELINLLAATPAADKAGDWKPLFNGKDLSG
jgi:hypothetical protein